MKSDALSQTSHGYAEALSRARFIYLATVRKDGNQSKAAPVWFTTTSDGLVLIQVPAKHQKVKRIRRGSPVIVWIGKRSGPAFVGKAEITSEPAVTNQIVKDYPQKYLLARLGFHKPSQEKFVQGQIIAIKIVSVRDLPEGFASAPGTLAPK